MRSRFIIAAEASGNRRSEAFYQNSFINKSWRHRDIASKPSRFEFLFVTLSSSAPTPATSQLVVQHSNLRREISISAFLESQPTTLSVRARFGVLCHRSIVFFINFYVVAGRESMRNVCARFRKKVSCSRLLLSTCCVTSMYVHIASNMLAWRKWSRNARVFLFLMMSSRRDVGSRTKASEIASAYATSTCVHFPFHIFMNSWLDRISALSRSRYEHVDDLKLMIWSRAATRIRIQIVSHNRLWLSGFSSWILIHLTIIFWWFRDANRSSNQF